jgi:hypothetical protein
VPPASHSHRVLRPILRYPSGLDRLQNSTPHGYGAPPHAPPASERSHPPPAGSKPRSHLTWSCAANTRQPLQTYTLLTHTILTNQTMYTTRRPPCRYLPTSLNHTCRSSFGINPRPSLLMATSAPGAAWWATRLPLPHSSATPNRGSRHGLAAGTRPGP